MAGQKKRTRNDGKERDNAPAVAATDDASNYQPEPIKQYIKDLGLDLDEYQLHPEENAHGPKTTELWLEEHCRSKLSAYEKSWKEGNIAGLAAAVKLCGVCAWALPPWCEVGVQKVIAESYFKGKSSKAGRHSRTKTKLQQDRVHFIRWCKVTELRDCPEKMEKAGYKPTWEAAFEKASLDLRGTEGRGEPGAIKDSYRRVQADMRAGRAGRYYIP